MDHQPDRPVLISLIAAGADEAAAASALATARPVEAGVSLCGPLSPSRSFGQFLSASATAALRAIRNASRLADE